KAALASGFEGVIAKRRDSQYEAGKRSPAWVKIKPTRSAEFVVGGITKGKGSRAALGALLLGYWDDGKLRYCGHVGSGFDDRTIAGYRDRRCAAPARQQEGRPHHRGGAARAQAHPSRSRLLARRLRPEAERDHQARPAALLRAGLALHAHAPRRPAAHHDPHA